MRIEETLTHLPVVIVAAHADDETIGAGGILGRMSNPHIVHVTDGAPANPEFWHAAGFQTREEYAQARRRELACALKIAGIAESSVTALDITDQRASYEMAELALRLGEILGALSPAIVLTHPYEGGHPDHDATAFAVHAACRRVSPAPRILEFTSYHAAGAADTRLESGRFLTGQDQGEIVLLPPAERCRKEAMLACFETQTDMLRNFQSGEERFREAPVYDFEEPPHAGRLFYETFPTGMTGELWSSLAAEASRQLETPALP